MTAYNIDGNNYFKLRDLGEKFNFGVDYDEATNTVKLSTDVGNDIEYRTDLLTPSVRRTPIPGVEYSGT